MTHHRDETMGIVPSSRGTAIFKAADIISKQQQLLTLSALPHLLATPLAQTPLEWYLNDSVQNSEDFSDELPIMIPTDPQTQEAVDKDIEAQIKAAMDEWLANHSTNPNRNIAQEVGEHSETSPYTSSYTSEDCENHPSFVARISQNANIKERG